MTTWLSLIDIDRLAARRGVNIVQGSRHHIRVAYDDAVREVASEPLDASELSDHGPGLIAEITVVRMWKTLRTFAPLFRELNFPRGLWDPVAKEYLDALVAYWSWSPNEEDLIGESRELGIEPQRLRDSIAERGQIITRQLRDQLDPLIRYFSTGEWLYRELPEPEPRYTWDLRRTEGHLELPLGESQLNPEMVDWGSISFQLF